MYFSVSHSPPDNKYRYDRDCSEAKNISIISYSNMRPTTQEYEIKSLLNDHTKLKNDDIVIACTKDCFV